MCDSKRGYSKEDAELAIKRIHKQHGRHGRPEYVKKYECPHCGQWHIAKDRRQE
jgi:hypothetical protein